MTDLPPDILAKIDEDVERYRQVRINAALKRLTPAALDRLEKRRERDFVDDNRHEIVNWFVGGQSTYQIAARFKFVSRIYIRDAIETWMCDRLNPHVEGVPFDYDKWVSPGRFNEKTWPARIFNMGLKP